jgi:hypothetical protein
MQHVRHDGVNRILPRLRNPSLHFLRCAQKDSISSNRHPGSTAPFRFPFICLQNQTKTVGLRSILFAVGIISLFLAFAICWEITRYKPVLDKRCSRNWEPFKQDFRESSTRLSTSGTLRLWNDILLVLGRRKSRHFIKISLDMGGGILASFVVGKSTMYFRFGVGLAGELHRGTSCGKVLQKFKE